ncbi:50S ribosomal protein L33 [Paenibacillus montanisoli]|uniref:Large ribosomal subunit protein bL33 n=1 Tax=Paenibacillus montanisoli TaxID=2081970 RepID=A0A328UB97_9BACL|nr:50S ribosomal protein L33 [Paenibacillus montanisoli]RAP77316.1 50S ribosomal protein L33 [Paenibacillus montanisoli]
MRVTITLACTECGDRNYMTTKNKKNNPGRLELRKYCPSHKKVTLHRETRS